MSGEIFACITLASWTLGVRSFTKAASYFDPGVINKFRMLLAMLFLLVAYIFTESYSFWKIVQLASPMQWFWLGASGFIGLAVGDLFAFISYKKIGPTKTSLLTTFAPVAALITGIFPVNEQFNFIGLTGMLITISGIVLLIMNRKNAGDPGESSIWKLNGGIMAGIIAGVTQGIGIVFTKKGALISELPPIQIAFVRILCGFILLLIVEALMGKWQNFIKPIQQKPKEAGFIVLGALFGPVIGVVFSIAALQRMDASAAQTIFSLLPITVMIYGYFLLKEKITLQMLLSAVLAISGVVILVWRLKITEFFEKNL